MKENKLAFLIRSFSRYEVHISDDFTQEIIRNPSCGENIIVYYYENDDFTKNSCGFKLY